MDVIERFEERVHSAPSATALVSAEERVAYGELEARSNRLAHLLRESGVGPETVVGLCMRRRPEAVVGILAILKAGGAFLPMDPRHPAQRLVAMLKTAGARLLLSENALRAEIPSSGIPLLIHEEIAPRLATLPATRPQRLVAPESIRCTIFTSGSTGLPKGIALPSRTIENVAAWAARHTVPPRVCVQFSSLGFDMSLQDVFGTLLSGGTLVHADEEHRQDPVELLRLLARERVERIYLSPAFLRQLAQAYMASYMRRSPQAERLRLREIVSAGEPLRLTREVRAFLGALDGVVLENQYGPSETHQATAYTMTGDPAGWPDTPPLGRPIPGVAVHLLDGSLAPVPDGEPGEVWIAGAGVARGYEGRPDLTAERFLPCPYAGPGPYVPGARMYRTGDLARRTPDGELEFLGRADDQVKIRGYRVEPGEVDAAFTTHPDIREAATVAHRTPDGGWRLTSYLVPAAGRELPTTRALRGFAGARLPEYMLPSAFVPLAALPLNRNGKVDRGALPPPDSADRGSTTVYAPPGNSQEALVHDIWAEALGRERIGVDDNFLDLGGNSLLAMQIVSQLRAVFSVELFVRTLFECPTVRELTAAVEQAIIAEIVELG